MKDALMPWETSIQMQGKLNFVFMSLKLQLTSFKKTLKAYTII